MSEHRTTDVLVAFGIGALVGAVGALLLAPATGEETRRRLGDFSRDAMDRAGSGIEQAKRVAGEQVERITHAVKEGKEAYARETAKG